MKIRMSFVSNSSSASYVAKIYGLSLTKFINDITEEFYASYFDRENLIDAIKKDISFGKKYIKNGGVLWKKNLDLNQKLYDMLIKDLTNKKKQIKQKKQYVPMGIQNRNVIKKLLKAYYGITFNCKDDIITLNAYTSMHNDIGDVPEIMRNIVSFYVFSKYKVECEIESDDMER
jgi:hypothetical protein